MNVEVSLQLYEMTQEFIKDKTKAKDFVHKIEQMIDSKFEFNTTRFLVKDDKVQILNTIYVVGVVQFIAIVASVIGIVSFILK